MVYPLRYPTMRRNYKQATMAISPLGLFRKPHVYDAMGGQVDYSVNGFTPAIVADFVNGVYRSPLGDDDIANVMDTVAGGYTLTGAGMYTENTDLPRFLNAAIGALDQSNGISFAIEGTFTYADHGTTAEVYFFSSVYSHSLQASVDTSGAAVGRLRINASNGVDGSVILVGADKIAPGSDIPVRAGFRATGSNVQGVFNGELTADQAVSAVGNWYNAAASAFTARTNRAGNQLLTTMIRVWEGDIGEDGLVEVGAPFDQRPFDAVILWGQSNMMGPTLYDGSGAHPSASYQWDYTGRGVRDVDVQLSHGMEASGNYMGPDVQFAIDYLAANPGRNLLFIPVALGSTGFVSNNWNPGDPQYENMVSQVRFAMAHCPNATLVGALCILGERDANSSESEVSFAANLDAAIAGFRSDIAGAANLPFVFGQIGTFLSTDFFPTRDDINTAIADTPNRVENTAVASSSGLVSNGDGIHYDAASLRTMGSNLYSALSSIS